jgi:hypothetical protein
MLLKPLTLNTEDIYATSDAFSATLALYLFNVLSTAEIGLYDWTSNSYLPSTVFTHRTVLGPNFAAQSVSSAAE